MCISKQDNRPNTSSAEASRKIEFEVREKKGVEMEKFLFFAFTSVSLASAQKCCLGVITLPVVSLSLWFSRQNMCVLYSSVWGFKS